MKARTLVAILVRRFGLQLEGIEPILPTYPTLADVDSPAALAAYQERKRVQRRTSTPGQRRVGAEGDEGSTNDE